MSTFLILYLILKEDPMKLAEALNNRADLKKRLFQLKERLLRNSKVQEGEEPSENPEDLLI